MKILVVEVENMRLHGASPWHLGLCCCFRSGERENSTGQARGISNSVSALFLYWRA